METFEDLNNGTPSVFHKNEILSGFDNNPLSSNNSL